MAGTKWERFLARLDEHGIITPNGNTPEELADGIAECMAAADYYEDDAIMSRLYLIIALERLREWQQTCDKLADINERCQKELHKIPHKIVEKMKAAGLPNTKGVGKACPKKFETVSKEEITGNALERKKQRDLQRTVDLLSPMPRDFQKREGDGTAIGQAMELYSQGVRPF